MTYAIPRRSAAGKRSTLAARHRRLGSRGSAARGTRLQPGPVPWTRTAEDSRDARVGPGEHACGERAHGRGAHGGDVIAVHHRDGHTRAGIEEHGRGLVRRQALGGIVEPEAPGLQPDDFFIPQISGLDPEDPAVRRHFFPHDRIRQRSALGECHERVLEGGNHDVQRQELLQLGAIQDQDLAHDRTSRHDGSAAVGDGLGVRHRVQRPRLEGPRRIIRPANASRVVSCLS